MYDDRLLKVGVTMVLQSAYCDALSSAELAKHVGKINTDT
jgi:hypothetical protein